MHASISYSSLINFCFHFVSFIIILVHKSTHTADKKNLLIKKHTVKASEHHISSSTNTKYHIVFLWWYLKLLPQSLLPQLTLWSYVYPFTSSSFSCSMWYLINFQIFSNRSGSFLVSSCIFLMLRPVMVFTLWLLSDIWSSWFYPSDKYICFLDCSLLFRELIARWKVLEDTDLDFPVF